MTNLELFCETQDADPLNASYPETRVRVQAFVGAVPTGLIIFVRGSVQTGRRDDDRYLGWETIYKADDQAVPTPSTLARINKLMTKAAYETVQEYERYEEQRAAALSKVAEHA